MQLGYGSYAWAANSVKIGWHNRTTLSEGGRPLSQVLSMDVEGVLAVSGQADCTTVVNAMQAALSAPYQDLKFLDDNGNNTHLVLLNAASLTGVRITSGPEFTTTHGSEYVSMRHFAFTAEAEYALAGTQAALVSFEETVTISGGGPRWVVREARRGPPVRQLVSEQTPYRARQTGTAVGWQRRPSPRPPIWPQWLIEQNPEVTNKSPRARGPGTTRQSHYPTSWAYTFASPYPLIGLPAVWNP